MSDNEIDAMVNEIDSESKDLLSQNFCLPTYDLARDRLRLVVRKHLVRLPLPTVPADATCGGCRWWAPENWCHMEPQLIGRNKSDYACRHYEGKK